MGSNEKMIYIFYKLFDRLIMGVSLYGYTRIFVKLTKES
jgi:hypothetical protein